MFLFRTRMTVMNRLTGSLESVDGLIVSAPSFDLAQQYCDECFPYLKVTSLYEEDPPKPTLPKMDCKQMYWN